MDALVTVATVVTLVGGALLAGLWFTFSMTVMKALGQLPTPQGITAMQRINVVILNPVFGLAFGGTAIVALFLAIASLFELDEGSAWLRLVGAVVFWLGTMIVTFVANVPLNNALEAADPDSPAGAEVWATFRRRWTQWNHVRAVTSTAAVVLLAIALLQT